MLFLSGHPTRLTSDQFASSKALIFYFILQLLCSSMLALSGDRARGSNTLPFVWSNQCFPSLWITSVSVLRDTGCNTRKQLQTIAIAIARCLCTEHLGSNLS